MRHSTREEIQPSKGLLNEYCFIQRVRDMPDSPAHSFTTVGYHALHSGAPGRREQGEKIYRPRGVSHTRRVHSLLYWLGQENYWWQNTTIFGSWFVDLLLMYGTTTQATVAYVATIDASPHLSLPYISYPPGSRG